MSMDNTFDWDGALADAASAPDYGALLPPNNYVVRVEKAEFKHASTGSPMIKLTLAVVGGPYDGTWVWFNAVAKPGEPKSASGFARNMLALGLTQEWLAANKPAIQQLPDILLNRHCVAVVINENYNGSMQNNVKTIRRVDDVTAAAGAVAAPIPGGVGVPQVGGVPQVPAAPAVAPAVAPPVVAPPVVQAPPVAPPVQPVAAPPVVPPAPPVAAPPAAPAPVAAPAPAPMAAPPVAAPPVAAPPVAPAPADVSLDASAQVAPPVAPPVPPAPPAPLAP